MTQKIMTFCLGLLACLSITGCVSATQELPYGALPEITVATEFRLTASPSHPTAYLPVDPIAPGTQVQIVGRDKNAAWLLVLHNNILGWMPTFYSRDNLGTLSTAFTVEPLSDKCATFQDATFGLDTTWDSTVEGGAIALGSLYRPATSAQTNNALLAIQIDGAGQAVQSDYLYTALTASSSLVLFAFELTDLAKDSQITFSLSEAGSDPFYFQSLFFSDSCGKSTHFTNQLPVGVLKGGSAQSNGQIVEQPTATLQPESSTIVHTSDARTPTVTPTPTPFPTLDGSIYGEIAPIHEVIASSFDTRYHAPADMVDGNIESYWISQFNDDVGSQIELHLDSPMALAGIRIYSPGANRGKGLPKELALRFADGSQQSMSLDSMEGWYTENFPIITTDIVTVVVVSLHNVSPINSTRFYEIQLISAPAPPAMLTTDNSAVAIKLRTIAEPMGNDSTGHVMGSFLKQDGQIIANGTVNLFPLEEDVAGDLLRMTPGTEELKPDKNGHYSTDLPAQKYLLTLTIPDSGEEPIVPGWYSDAGYNGADKNLFRGIVFPVEAGKTTEIEVQFSQLIVGVLNETGKAVRGSDYPEWAVTVCSDALTQVTDDTLRCASTSIDRRGAATFQIAPGDYHIRVVNDEACYWEFPVKIGLNEAKQEIVTIDSTQTDACLGDK